MLTVVPLLLVRHAQAGSRSDWSGGDRDRPLTTRGRRQAQGLVGLVGPWAPQRVLSSPYLRCVETVGPLALAMALTVEVDERLAEGQPGAIDLVREVASYPVAVCTHGDVIPEILVAIADEDRVDLGPRPRQAKGSVWVLEYAGGRFTEATYLPPPG